MNYQVADFVLRIKNASLARRKQVVMPFSNLNMAIGKALVHNGYLAHVKEETSEAGHKVINAELRYERRKPVVQDVKIISKPSLRVYVTAEEINPYHEKAMTSILTTNTGVMSGLAAKKKGVGGELLFKIA